MLRPEDCGPDTRSSPARPAASTPLERLQHATTWSSGGWCRRGGLPAGQGPAAGEGRTPHDPVARPARRCAARGAGAGRGGGVAREPLFGLPGLRLHLLVAARSRSSAAWSRASALAWAWSRAAARWASPAWAACNAASACPARASAARTLGVVHGKAGDPLTLGLLDHLLGGVGHPRRGCVAP